MLENQSRAQSIQHADSYQRRISSTVLTLLVYEVQYITNVVCIAHVYRYEICSGIHIGLSLDHYA